MAEHTPGPHSLARMKLVEAIAGRIEESLDLHLCPEWNQEEARQAISVAVPDTNAYIEESINDIQRQEESQTPHPERIAAMRRKVAIRKAAPQLLEACKAAVEFTDGLIADFDGCTDDSQDTDRLHRWHGSLSERLEWLDLARAAIAAATQTEGGEE